MVLGKRPVPGRPADLDNRRALAVGAGRRGLDIFFSSRLSVLSFFALSLGAGPI